MKVCIKNKSDEEIALIIDFLKTLSDERRLKILCFLGNGEKCVGKISEFLNLSQNLVSHHLKVLRENKIVKTRKNGLKVFYSLENTYVLDNINYLKTILIKK